MEPDNEELQNPLEINIPDKVPANVFIELRNGNGFGAYLSEFSAKSLVEQWHRAPHNQLFIFRTTNSLGRAVHAEDILAIEWS